jgi:hypothetical protein
LSSRHSVLYDELPVARPRFAAPLLNAGGRAGKTAELLSLAEPLFDVLLTLDKIVPFQQEVSSRAVAVLIVRARSNRIQDLLPFIAMPGRPGSYSTRAGDAGRKNSKHLKNAGRAGGIVTCHSGPGLTRSSRPCRDRTPLLCTGPTASLRTGPHRGSSRKPHWIEYSRPALLDGAVNNGLLSTGETGEIASANVGFTPAMPLFQPERTRSAEKPAECFGYGRGRRGALLSTRQPF